MSDPEDNDNQGQEQINEKSHSSKSQKSDQKSDLEELKENSESGIQNEDQNSPNIDNFDDQEGGGDLLEGEDQQNQEEIKLQESQTEQKDNFSMYKEKQKQVIQWCKDNGEWQDPDFPADSRALFRDPQNIPEWGREVRKITWVRPRELAKDAKFMIDREGDAKQGAFGESWFIGAVIIIATRGDLLEKLFFELDYFEEYGFVTFQFFKNGEWKQVMVDTRLPYDPESKQLLFTYCANPSEFWIPLMEKAYCKMHGCYESICDGTIIEGLVDLTGGVSEGWILNEPETSKMIENNQLWQTMMSYFHQKFYLGCVNFVEGKGTKNADTGTHGILENHYYGICDIREFPKENLKLIRIRNPWGTDGGWNGPFCDDSEEWDKHRNLREELKLVFKSKKSDGTWWMSFNDWYVHFNKMYVCKVFPETWETYSIESRWVGKTNGGVCPPRQVYEGKDQMPFYQQLDTDDKWFNNPQFRLKVNKETKLYISLMLEDEKLSKQSYVQCNFMVIMNKNRINRIWERPQNQDIIIEANQSGKILAQREVTQYVVLKRQEGKNYGYYMIIPNMIIDSKKEEKRTFFLRVFASETIELVEMPETLEVSQDGQWGDSNAGGRRKIDGKVNNPGWCRNPQYFLNLQYPTHLKIILRKTGNLKKTRQIKIGMTICRFESNSEKNKVQKLQLPPIKKTKQAGTNLARLLAQTQQQLEPPVMEQIERKLQIGYGEKFKEATYCNDEFCALYFNWNPTEGPFVLIPSLDADGDKQANYKLTIYSNSQVQLQKLDETKNQVLIGKWESDISDGGCHLYEDPYEKDSSKKTWSSNPKFLLQFKDTNGPLWLKVTLAIAEKNWKAKTKNTVGGMIGMYLLKKTDQKISIEQKLRDPNFLPVNVLNEEYRLDEINKNGYYIMPCTYQNKISGTFILSVTSDKEFTLVSLK